MLDSVLTAEASETTSLATGLGVFGLGMLIVIGMLALLMIVLYLLIPIFSNISKKKEEKSQTAKTPEPVRMAVPAPAPAAVEDDGETIAAIISAISAAEGKSPLNFRVVSFKRI